ncbi:CpsD/CapB family tyrosine-protein kinase [Domibacillus sp. PGB-M46]|uniref:CpsD/CapB family tyrosine-protein kinase n=1 Tax=Domibacillus sp. PGB-M46 TaxID=2910255 RepID=UPI001F567A87|nr:CpsD/CapB family tyrosine-protein kinase [Domibacillus sp. PGB-M46]MCI2253116.1 CpsD/CapB family tyrosine-protein kinase [Domibacillus sp. PGB-M46]
MALKRNKQKPAAPGAAKRKLITNTDPKSPISEQYRTIRTNILFSSVDETLRTMLVTSTSPGEGKSTTVANLAVVFANQGKKVLIIDADMRKPTMHYTFGLQNTVGLTNVLTNQATLQEACVQTNVENLSALPSGPIPPNPAELLGSFAMKEFLAKAQENFDYIFFDTPPVLAVTDAQVLANQCDGTVLVINSGKTEVEGAQKAKDLLQSAKAKLLGVVLNNRNMKESAYYYYYGSE